MNTTKTIATFSIVGFDPETGELGVGVQSKFIAVGSVVPWAKAGVGAVATQAFGNPSYGPDGLQLLEEGKSPEEALQALLAHDSDREERQVGIIDAKGNAATFTGENCYDWAGGVTGKNYAVQGNILVNEETVTAMGRAFEENKGSLAERLLAALDAAQTAGGDSRGKQSAALYVVKEQGGYGGFNDRYIDLRVDDHPEPIDELARLYKLQQLYFGETKKENILSIEGDTKTEVIEALNKWGYLSESNPENDAFHKALTQFLHTENFEERELEKGKIDKEVLEFMKNK
ncbi:DUF1028 domain-containing protein [Aquibacillus sp. 3ASR75-11]|uniref:DUF1028 domain-containing protein n=1 Tax=Terrihalobacillus insolitus TaxID=2950438 RepID=A0A9X3WQ79_9BACI|nr:DUF1028 domain-containing protein [Terrihalobacillus insolitus]MDC3412723.1 DUF1028 domain-containing protein [Terrihalobacillus insolitus]MDC3423800.1 DUF1028 domain-containing protein [Terrihalobacillus insolitus]